MKIYIGNLDFKVNENELRSAFEEHGQVDDVRIITDESTRRSKGFAFVTMDDNAEADKAIQALNGKRIADREIRVSESRPRV